MAPDIKKTTKLPLKYVKRNTISRAKEEVPSSLQSDQHCVASVVC